MGGFDSIHSDPIYTTIHDTIYVTIIVHIWTELFFECN